MSRYRNDRDDYDRDDEETVFAGRDPRYRGDEGSRYGRGREDYDRGGAGQRERDYNYDDPYARGRTVGGGRDYYNYNNLGQGRSEERPAPRYGESRYDRYTGRGEQRGRNRREDYDPEGRSLWEEGMDYFRGRGGGDRERGASRSHVRCRDIMTRDVTVARRDTTLQEVAVLMRDEDTGVIPVVDETGAPPPPTNEPLSDEARRINSRMFSNGRLVGLITDRDIVVRAIADGKDTRVTRAEEVMTTDIHTARPNDRVIDAIRKMGDKQVRRIPVVDDQGNLRGIISMADVALETESDRELAGALEEISSGASFWGKVFG